MKLATAMPGVAAALALSLTACVPNATTGDETISVSSTDDACVLTAATAPSGNVVFSVTNDGSAVTEFYLLADDGLRVISEVENIGPGLTRDLVVQVGPGDYFTACKPGMVGDGIRAAFVVTDSGVDVGPVGDRAAQHELASEQYLAYVRDQVSTLQSKTDAFLALFVAGDDNGARAQYADARVHWERIEPIAEAFGDLDPSMDAREADLEAGDDFTGWHHMEKILWPPSEGYTVTQAEREALADQLAADTQTLATRIYEDDFEIEVFQIGNGAKELLDEVASGKVTGEEEFWSHTDLWDFQANVDGAWVAFSVLRPVVEQTEPDLVLELDTRFGELNDLLAQYGSVDEGFVYYDELTDDQVLELARAVDALGEPLSRLTAAAVL